MFAQAQANDDSPLNGDTILACIIAPGALIAMTCELQSMTR
jgi:hypothetical protein